MKQWLSLLFISALCTYGLASAEDCKKDDQSHKNAWDGTNVQLGYIFNTGNTKSLSFNVATNIIYNQEAWQNTFLGEFQYAEQNGVANRQYFHLNDQAQFDIHETERMKDYIFVNGDSVMTRFSPYDYQTSLAGGYGRTLFNTDTFTWKAQAGPGVRYSKLQGSNQTDTDLMFMLQTDASLKLGKWGTLGQSIRYELASPYNYLLATTSLTNNITGHIAIKGSFTLTNYSEIPSTSTKTIKTDTVTNISLVYNF